MNVEDILARVRDGELALAEARALIDSAYFQVDVDAHLTVDLDRHRRTGAAEVVYGAGKTPTQVLAAVTAVSSSGSNVLVTRSNAEQFAAVQARFDDADWHADAALITMRRADAPVPPNPIAVISAGTSDFAVAEEAAITAEFFDNTVLRISDVGVAGLHRLLARLPEIRTASVVIVVAGMEGALPSVVGGLIAAPIVPVPTSVGYGAAIQGVAALLGMLTSCASGVSVVNIDNGFGAGFIANRINRLQLGAAQTATIDNG